eukprot:scaffold3013_cov113-Isochrysis_galbana.AAC.9
MAPRQLRLEPMEVDSATDKGAKRVREDSTEHRGVLNTSLGLRGLGQLRSVSRPCGCPPLPRRGTGGGRACSGHSPAPATCEASSPGEHGFLASGGRGCRLARRASRAARLLVDVCRGCGLADWRFGAIH